MAASTADRPPLRLAVQYAGEADVPGRAQVRRWVRTAVEVARRGDPGIGAASFTVRFVDAEEGRMLNHRYRGKDDATNVLTFPYPVDGDAAAVEADIVICVPVVEAEARAQGKTMRAHCAHLVVHGVLHAVGHDHEAVPEAETMETLERVALRRFRIADPYAVDEGRESMR